MVDSGDVLNIHGVGEQEITNEALKQFPLNDQQAIKMMYQ